MIYLFIYFVNDFSRTQELQHFEKVPLSNSRNDWSWNYYRYYLDHFHSIILMFIVILFFALLYSMDEIINPTFTIKAIGHQWYWM
jgi:heme/copper-type cytochrome/quinol oxidase subunit 2